MSESDRKTSKKHLESHYTTLGLKQDCTEKEIKNAFLALSKAHHPDLNPNGQNQEEKFVEIYEAYSVLSKPQRRLIYDTDLRLRERSAQSWNGSNLNVETDAPHYTTWRDESIWHMRDKTERDNFRNKDKPYYGIKGINRVSNYWIAGGTIVAMLIGAFFHYTALKHSAIFTVSQLDTRDEKHARELFSAREKAKQNGNDMQIELLKERFGWEAEYTEDSSNNNRTK